MPAAWVPAVAEEPPTEELPPQSSDVSDVPNPTHCLWLLGLIPSAVVGSPPAALYAAPEALPVLVVPAAVPVSAGAPVTVPVLPPLMDL